MNRIIIFAAFLLVLAVSAVPAYCQSHGEDGFDEYAEEAAPYDSENGGEAEETDDADNEMAETGPDGDVTTTEDAPSGEGVSIPVEAAPEESDGE